MAEAREGEGEGEGGERLESLEACFCLTYMTYLCVHTLNNTYNAVGECVRDYRPGHMKDFVWFSRQKGNKIYYHWP